MKLSLYEQETIILYNQAEASRTLRHLLFGNHNTYHNPAHKATVF